MLPQTGVTFSCDNAALQKLFDEAERKCLHNLKDFGAYTVLVGSGTKMTFPLLQNDRRIADASTNRGDLFLR